MEDTLAFMSGFSRGSPKDAVSLALGEHAVKWVTEPRASCDKQNNDGLWGEGANPLLH